MRALSFALRGLSGDEAKPGLVPRLHMQEALGGLGSGDRAIPLQNVITYILGAKKRNGNERSWDGSRSLDRQTRKATGRWHRPAVRDGAFDGKQEIMCLHVPVVYHT